jgi:hypothetical protein
MALVMVPQPVVMSESLGTCRKSRHKFSRWTWSCRIPFSIDNEHQQLIVSQVVFSMDLVAHPQATMSTVSAIHLLGRRIRGRSRAASSFRTLTHISEAAIVLAAEKLMV